MKKAWIPGICFVLMAVIMPVGAGEFPNRTMTVICPYGAGGGTDLLLRGLSDAAAKIADVNIVVQNVTGGNGAVGIVTMMAATPDGYTVGSCSGEWIALKELNLTPPGFDYNNAEKIMHYNFDAAAFVVAKDSPYKTIEEVLEYAKTNPEQIVLGVTAAGGSHHLASLLIQELTGTRYNIVPYSEGANAVMAALMGDHIQVACVGPAEAAAQVDAGNARLLAITAEKRNQNYPDVPTFKDKGYNVIYGSWRALAVPKGTPAEIVSRLEDIFYQAAQAPAFVEFCDKGGFTIDILNKEEFEKRFVEQEKLIKEVCRIYLEDSE